MREMRSKYDSPRGYLYPILSILRKVVACGCATATSSGVIPSQSPAKISSMFRYTRGDMLSQLPPSGSLNTGCGMSAAVWIVRSIEDVHSLARTETPRGSDEPRELHIVSPGVVAKYGSS